MKIEKSFSSSSGSAEVPLIPPYPIPEDAQGPILPYSNTAGRKRSLKDVLGLESPFEEPEAKNGETSLDRSRPDLSVLLSAHSVVSSLPEDVNGITQEKALKILDRLSKAYDNRAEKPGIPSREQVEWKKASGAIQLAKRFIPTYYQPTDSTIYPVAKEALQTHVDQALMCHKTAYLFETGRTNPAKDRKYKNYEKKRKDFKASAQRAGEARTRWERAMEQLNSASDARKMGGEAPTETTDKEPNYEPRNFSAVLNRFGLEGAKQGFNPDL